MKHLSVTKRPCLSRLITTALFLRAWDLIGMKLRILISFQLELSVIDNDFGLTCKWKNFYPHIIQDNSRRRGLVLKTNSLFQDLMSSRPRSNVLVGCKQSFKVEASKSLFAVAGAGGGGFWVGNYGKCANGEQELILARPSICAFVSFFLRCIGTICLTVYISVSLFRKFRPSRKYRVSNIEKNSLSVLKRWQS